MTYRLPSLNTLRAFEAAARHLSFKTAADELGVTAGAVSQQVKKLENSLGVLLFRRLPNGLLLTREGETYLPAITQVFEDLTHATEQIAPDINSRKFTVGLCPSIRTRLPANWPHHNETLRRHVRECIETSDIDMLFNNELDCLIRPGGGPYRDLALVVVTCPQQAYELHFVCRPGTTECAQSRAILADLALHLASHGE
ncbi:LysR family transcriptional regulator [Roseibium sp. HPY-6]|uniref:LysR family transcriptional regulator n=1 Tax=Roseibium sp. HPY-6 TaxID=3229852 RepID=UPI00338DB740